MNEPCKARVEVYGVLTVACDKMDIWHLDHAHEIEHPDGTRVLITWWASNKPADTDREEAMVAQAMALVEKRLQEGTLSSADTIQFLKLGKFRRDLDNGGSGED